MARLLFTVEDTFMIEGRGLVPVPGIIPEGNEKFMVGHSILLKRLMEKTRMEDSWARDDIWCYAQR